ncbi:hypothetical protein N7475_000867 [Penicillium sp. IBT 31633x]|nr:hypothetical protein N7475_000867 [Penicillium sp. IBT 31633x]
MAFVLVAGTKSPVYVSGASPSSQSAQQCPPRDQSDQYGPFRFSKARMPKGGRIGLDKIYLVM